jgi:hypothetical protein
MAIESVIGWGALAVGAGVWALDSGPPVTLSLDQWLCALAALILGQGLFRDLRVIRARRAEKAALEAAGIKPHAEPAPGGPLDAPSLTQGRRGAEINLCVESTTGVGLLALALLYVAFPAPPPITLPRGAAIAGAGVVLLIGWGTRDWVLTLRYIRDHYDIPVYRNRK